MNKRRISVIFMMIGLLVSPIETSVAATRNSVEVPSQEEIREYIRSSGAYLNQKVTYSENPSTTSPYSAGKLSNDTYDNALGMVKNIRYIAGLSTDIEWDDTYNERAQAASLVCAVNQALSHTPAQPVGMEDALYNLGYSGASSSNIAMGYSTLNSAILTGWMNDSDSSNRDRLGHRRWILNPAMKKTGFGMVGRYSAMHVIGGSVSTGNVTVMWPAQQMPFEYFYGGTWSVSTGNTETMEDISVKLVRVSDQRTWNFSQSENEGDDNSGYFNVNNDGYGSRGCIIFKPNNIEYHAGDVYNVSISGSSIGEITYSTEFFPLYPVEAITLNDTTLLMEEDSQTSLSATIVPKEATVRHVSWDSSDPAVVRVDDMGRVTALKEGKADIIAKATDGSGVTTKCEVTVTPKQLCGDNAKYEFNSASGELRIYGTGRMYDYTQTNGDDPVPWKDILTEIKSVRIESGITDIGQYAFFNCNNLSSATLPDSLESIGSHAFDSNVNLKEMTFPESLKVIDSYAFQGCNMEQLIIPADTTIKYGAFHDNASLETLKVGGNCILCRAAFGKCTSLTRVALGEGSVYDDEGLVTPGPFYGCTNLKYMKLPNSWVLYDSEKNYNYVLQFKDCEALVNITLSNDNPNYKVIDHVIYSLDGQKLIYYPRGLTAESYTILSSTREILNYAFYGQTYLKYVEIPASVNQIGDTAFEGISELQIEYLENQEDVWTGNTDTTWYKENVTSFDISTPEELAGIVRLLQQNKSFENKRINLTKDIFMNEKAGDKRNEWILDGTECAFQGVFNGNGHTIYNMYVPAACKGGLFAQIGERGIVKAITMKHGIFEYGGAIANQNSGGISFCHNDSDVSSNSLGYVGGITNRNEGYIYGCGNYGTVYSQSASVGGIVGINTRNTACVSESRNLGDVFSTYIVSGIVGSNYAWIYNCYNRGKLCGERSLYGITYNLGQTASVFNCYSVGNYDADIDALWFKDAISEAETVENCYYASPEIESEYGEEITQSELKKNSMPAKLNQAISGGFYADAWQVDTKQLNDGFPVTTAEIYESKQQYKSKPEVWFPSTDKSVDLYDGEIEVSYSHYFDQSEARVYIENTKLADISYSSGEESVITIKPKAVGESNICVAYDETGDTQAVIRKFAISVSHEHVLNHIEAREATASGEGNMEYWHCDKCGKYYSDANAVTEISQAETVIAKEEVPSTQAATEGGSTEGDSSTGDGQYPIEEAKPIDYIQVTPGKEGTGDDDEDASYTANPSKSTNKENISVTTDKASDSSNDSLEKLKTPDTPTKFNIANKRTYKISKKVKIKDSDGIKTIRLNGKLIKHKKGKKSCSFKLSSYKKYLKKKNKWNKLVVTDMNGIRKTIKFKMK
ncbi:MAG: leucine-rich repeat protein [Lachnospiraceae bacterium]|nr:leucine-rich repeat protein [Lachnospiraceae bacterium]